MTIERRSAVPAPPIHPLAALATIALDVFSPFLKCSTH